MENSRKFSSILDLCLELNWRLLYWSYRTKKKNIQKKNNSNKKKMLSISEFGIKKEIKVCKSSARYIFRKEN